jgi:hypothetical protein
LTGPVLMNEETKKKPILLAKATRTDPIDTAIEKLRAYFSKRVENMDEINKLLVMLAERLKECREKKLSTPNWNFGNARIAKDAAAILNKYISQFNLKAEPKGAKIDIRYKGTAELDFEKKPA